MKPDPASYLFGLSGLPVISPAQTRSISPENPTGERGGGARAVPSPDHPASTLGKGWKVRPYITIPAGGTVQLAEIKGPGTISHIWLTCAESAYRSSILKMYWDDETTPSVEAPLGDFFAVAHGVRYAVNSLPIVVNPSGGMNSYWRMPFRRSCRIELENQATEPVKHLFYQIDYELAEVDAEAAYFHARWHRSVTTEDHPEHLILEASSGPGNYAGTFLAWTQHAEGWWGEGEVKFFIDGDAEYPTICGTGTEDYVGGAWCFGDTYSTPFLGYPYTRKEREDLQFHSLYRWHILDPIRFSESLRVTVQALGWYATGKYRPLEDEIASVAYWYQRHAPRAIHHEQGVR